MPYHIRRSHERKYFDYGWLKTYHTFSFGSYYDPRYMGFRSLRVINEDRVQPGSGFPAHEHENMEIISVILDGELAHKDSTGTESVMKKNEIQCMSAGSGIRHSEYNHSKEALVHFLQIWIKPDSLGISPGYQQMQLPVEPTGLHPFLIASKEGRDHSLRIQQDAYLYFIWLDDKQNIDLEIQKNRYAWLQILEGNLKMNNDTLQSGDGVAIEPESFLELQGMPTCKLLYFNLN